MLENAVEFDGRLSRGDVGRQAQQRHVVEHAGRLDLGLGPGKRLEELRPARPGAHGGQIDEAGKSERVGQHADYLHRLVVQGDDATEHRGIAAVATLPQLVRQHSHASASGIAVVGPEDPSEQRLDPQQPEEARQDPRPGEPFRRAVAGGDYPARLQRRQLPAGRLAGAAPRVDGTGVHVPERELVQFGDYELHGHQPVRLPVGERRQQDAVDERIDGGRGADAEAQRRHDHRREERVAAQRSQRQSDVPKQVRQRPDAARIPHRFLDGDDSAQPQMRLPPRLERAHAAGEVLLRLHFQMETELLFHLGILVSAAQEAPEPPQPFLRQAHHSAQFSTPLTALAVRSHCARSASSCRRPSGVSA